MSSSSGGVPSAGDLVSNAKDASTVSKFLGGGIGGIFMAIVYVVIAPIRAAATGLGNFVGDFLGELSTTFNVSLIGNFATLLDAGAAGTGSWLRGESAGFIFAFIILLALAYIFSKWREYTDSDIPFLGNIPFYGTEDDD